MKKLSILFAFLCASLMGWAIDWSGIDWIGSTDATYANQFKVYGKEVVNIQDPFGTGLGIYITFPTSVNLDCTAPVGASFQKQGAAILFFLSTFVEKETNLTVVYNGGSVDFVIYNDKGTDPSAKPSPELSLNETSKTLEIDAVAETFQIEASKAAGSGAPSYSSSAEGVATVSSTGLVTAVGAGTTTITVSVAENDDFAADSKTLTVEVIDWPNIGWLQYSGDAYKLHISPNISDGFGGKRIENGNIWVGCPSAEFGECSIDFTHVGAGASFPLSNFTKARNKFTLVCQGTTYTFTVYRKFDGINLAKGMPATAGKNTSDAHISNNGNKGDRWGSAGAKHYVSEGDLAEDWWYVDLGAVYEISQVKILFETACPHDFDLLTSPNGDSWIVRGTYGEPTHKGNTDADYNEYSLSPAQNARYLKVFARSGYSDLAYGFSMWEFEAYGQPAENVDVNAPVLSSAAVSGTPTTTEIKIAVSATDTEEGTVTLFRVRESSLKMDRNFTAVDGKLTFSGLTDDTDYSFTITALDAMGNQSNAIVVNASTAVDPANPATMAPVPPARSADDVRAIYSDAYTDILSHDFQVGGQWGAVEGTRRAKSGNNYLLYDISSGTNITWGLNDGGANAIVAKDGYRAESKTGLDASGMEYLHVDIWSLVALTNINVKIRDAVFTTITHDGSGWQSYDLPLAGSEVDFTDIGWIKLDGITSSETRGKAAVDNYYFWKSPSGVKAVVVSTNNGSWGSVSAKVDEEDVSSVALNTEVTFTATPNEGYDFAYWTVNGDRVYTNPYALEITSNTNAVATFEPIRTAYCSTPVTDGQESRTLYLTISRTENANEYKILFEGSADNKISGDNVYVGTTLALTNVNGESSYAFTRASGEWHVSSEGFGSAYITFTATDFRDISFVSKGVDLFRDNSAGGGNLSSFNAFPDASLIKWDATCADAAAPDLAAPTATPIGPKSVRLELSATDDIAAMLTYYINYKPTEDEGEGTNVVVAGTSGETTYKNITGLTSSVDYTFSITVSDGTNTSEPQSCSATPTMPTAPVPPARPEMYVRSIYSNAYATMLDADFGKKSFANNDLTWEEMNVNGNHCLFYDLLPHESDAAFAIGGLNPGDIFVAQEAYQGDITEKDNRTTPDVSTMTHLHVDVWSNKATQYAVVQVNGQNVGEIPLLGNGWQQFDLPLETFKASHLADLKDVKYINFVGLRTPNPEEIAIDNVYFYAVPANISFGDDATDNTTTIADNANKFANVTINRNISADDTWYTLCLPFDMDAAKVSEVFGASTIATLVSSEDRGSLIHLNFDYVNAIEAGKPYLIKPGQNFTSGSTISNVQIKNVNPSAEGYKAIATHMHFQGTFDKIMLTGEDKRYVSANNELYSPNPSDGSKIGAFRCFFTIPEGSSALAPGRVAKIVFGEQTATGIDQMGVDAKSNGKLLINGVLYIIRDGKTYNAQGILIQ